MWGESHLYGPAPSDQKFGGRGVGTRGSGRALALAAACGAALLPGLARAETLADAIALAYQSNPTLQSQRAQLRALDEGYVQARAGWRPTAQLQFQGGYNKVQGRALTFGGGLGARTETETDPGSATFGIVQPIYTGGRTAAAVRAAEADVLAGRQALRAAEGQILQSVLQSYVDVRRDQQTLDIRLRDLAALQTQLDEARARFAAGEVTRTDVAQSESQLAAARALLSLSQGQLQFSRAAYANVVGQNPGNLAPEPELPNLPATVDQAFDVAIVANPTLRRAEITEEASRARIAEAKAANRPTLDLRGNVGYSGNGQGGGTLSDFDRREYNRSVSATAVFIQPLFTGGVNRSNIRRAQELNTSDRVEIETNRRNVVQAVSQAWNQVLSTRASASSSEEQVRAARVYFTATQEEYRVGQRSTLDVLVAEQTLRDAQLSVVDSRRNEFLGKAALLNAMGRLEARYLVEGAPLYEPADNFNRVKKIGSTFYEPLVAGLDNLGAPGPGRRSPIPAPAAATSATVRSGGLGLPPLAAPAVLSPTAPVPNTTSRSTPASVGADRDGGLDGG